jgi:pimeloyl-ACP methyl ester carboxylesterase
MTRSFATSRDDMAFTREQLQRITAQTLIVHGDRDPYYPVEMALELFRAIPESALWVVPYGGHGPVFEPLARAFVHEAVAHLGGSKTLDARSRT